MNRINPLTVVGFLVVASFVGLWISVINGRDEMMSAQFYCIHDTAEADRFRGTAKEMWDTYAELCSR